MSETPETDAIAIEDLIVRESRLLGADRYAALKEHARQLERQRDEAVKLRAEEIAEFNAGCDAYKNGVRFADLEVGPHDQTGIGYAWAAFDDLRKQRDEAVRILQNVDLMIDELLSQDGYVSQKTMIEVGEDIGSFLATLDRTEKT
jgi:hypothetical protein